MRFVEHRVPSILEQSLRILAIPSKRFDMPLIRYLSIAEMEAILNAPDLRTRSGIRDRAMLHVGFAAGLRGSKEHRKLASARFREMLGGRFLRGLVLLKRAR